MWEFVPSGRERGNMSTGIAVRKHTDADTKSKDHLHITGSYYVRNETCEPVRIDN